MYTGKYQPCDRQAVRADVLTRLAVKGEGKEKRGEG